MRLALGQDANKTPQDPWWKFGHVWLVIAGPALVVVASFITLYLAITRPDPVVSSGQYRQGASLAPAVQARNHAATGVLPSTPAAPGKP